MAPNFLICYTDIYILYLSISLVYIGSESVLAFITTMGKIYGWDLRSQDVAWKLSNMPKYGKYDMWCLGFDLCNFR